MKKTASIFFGILFFFALQAQEVQLNNLTLNEAIRYSLQHSPLHNIQKMKLEEARLQLEEAKLTHIPTVYASGDVRNNLIIPSTPVPAIILDPDASPDETIYMKFNTKWNAAAGLNLSYDLFNPEKMGRVAEQKQQLKILEYDAQLSENDLRAKVAMAYAECVIAQEQLVALAADTAYYTRALRQAEDLYAKEKIALTEKNNAQTALNESLMRYLQGEKILSDTKSNLLYVMGEELSPENIRALRVTESINELYEKIERTFSLDAATHLSELRQNQVIALAGERVRFAALKYAPTITLNGYYGTNFYNNEFKLFNSDLWRGNSYIGLSLKVPITQALSTSKEVSRLRMQETIERENLRDILQTREKDRWNEFSLLEVNRKNFRLSLENLEMSRQNLHAAGVQLEKGYILEKDFMEEQLKMQNARQNYMQAAFDVFSSYVAIEKLK